MPDQLNQPPGQSQQSSFPQRDMQEAPLRAQELPGAPTATQQLLRRAQAAQDGRDRAEEARTVDTNRVRAQLLKEYEASEQGACARQIRDVEAQMRRHGPADGFTLGDPTRGPST